MLPDGDRAGPCAVRNPTGLLPGSPTKNSLFGDLLTFPWTGLCLFLGLSWGNSNQTTCIVKSWTPPWTFLLRGRERLQDRFCSPAAFSRDCPAGSSAFSSGGDLPQAMLLQASRRRCSGRGSRSCLYSGVTTSTWRTNQRFSQGCSLQAGR